MIIIFEMKPLFEVDGLIIEEDLTDFSKYLT